MSDWLELFLRFLVIVNPFGLLLLWRRLTESYDARRFQRAILVVQPLAVGLLLVIIGIGDELLDALAITLPSFQIAAGVLLLVHATRRLLERDPFAVEPLASSREGAIVLARMLFAALNPATLAAAAFYGAERAYSTASTSVVAALLVCFGIAAARTLPRSRTAELGVRELGRLLLVVLVVLAVDMVMDGVEGA